MDALMTEQKSTSSEQSPLSPDINSDPDHTLALLLLRDQLRRQFPFIYDAYAATSCNSLLCGQHVGTPVLGILFSWDQGATHIAEIREFVARQSTLPVCFSDPMMNPNNFPLEQENEGTASQEEVDAAWKSLVRTRMALLHLPDVMAVSMNSQLQLVVFVCSLAFRPAGAHAIPPRFGSHDVIFRPGVFFSKGNTLSYGSHALRSRVCTHQRLFCEKTVKSFSLGGLIRHDDQVFAISCAHALPPSTFEEKIDVAVPIFKLEQIERDGATASVEEVYGHLARTLKIGSEPVIKTETFLQDSDSPFGSVVWAKLNNFTAAHEPFHVIVKTVTTEDEVDPLTDLPLKQVTTEDILDPPLGPPLVHKWQPTADDVATGMDASLIQLANVPDLTFFRHAELGRVRYSGKFATPRYGEKYFIVGAVHYWMSGKAHPIDVWTQEKDAALFVSRWVIPLLSRTGDLIARIHVVERRSSVLLLNQMAIKVDPVKSRTYHSDDDEGNSGAWIFHQGTGDAVGLYCSSTLPKSNIVVASPLMPIIDQIKADMGWEEWKPSYIVPIVENPRNK